VPKSVMDTKQNEYADQVLRIFGERFRDARIASGLSQRDVGRITHFSQSSISQWERGSGRGISMKQAAILAQAVDMTWDMRPEPEFQTPSSDTSEHLLGGAKRRKIAAVA